MDLTNKYVIHIKDKENEYLRFKKLLKYSDIITHAYSLGIDKNYRTKRANKENLDDEEYINALKCYDKLCKNLNLDYKNVVKPLQNHTDNVEELKKEKINKPSFDYYENTDGFITSEKNIVLSTTNADCILLLFFDPIKKVIANIHSGWKGTVKRISTVAVRKMIENYNCKPENIICCMCPSIRKCHFEVDEDVYNLFYNEFKNLKEIDKIKERKENKWHIDTILINKIILKKIGLKEENIIDSGICSVCNKDIIHSYRAEGKNYGLNTALISLI